MRLVSGVFVMPYVDLAENITKRRGHAMNIADDNDQHLCPSLVRTLSGSMSFRGGQYQTEAHFLGRNQRYAQQGNAASCGLINDAKALTLAYQRGAGGREFRVGGS